MIPYLAYCSAKCQPIPIAAILTQMSGSWVRDGQRQFCDSLCLLLGFDASILISLDVRSCCQAPKTNTKTVELYKPYQVQYRVAKQ